MGATGVAEGSSAGSCVCVCARVFVLCISNFIWPLTGPSNQLIAEHFCALKLFGLFVRLSVCARVRGCMCARVSAARARLIKLDCIDR